jgi:hypothetical protein
MSPVIRCECGGSRLVWDPCARPCPGGSASPSTPQKAPDMAKPEQTPPVASAGDPPADPPPHPVLGLMQNYLRVCGSGGMPKKQRELVERHVQQAAELGYFNQVVPNDGIEQALIDEMVAAIREMRQVPRSQGGPYGSLRLHRAHDAYVAARSMPTRGTEQRSE